MDSLKSCPHCGSNAAFVKQDGNMRSWPSISIVCENKDCFGNMTVIYDELSTDPENLKLKMTNHWNKRHAGLEFEQIRDSLKKLPMTWYPALLKTVVESGYAEGTFKRPNGASSFAKKVEATITE